MDWNPNAHELQAAVDRYMARHSDYENAELIRELSNSFVGYFTEDELLDLLFEFRADIHNWIDNFDPTPY